MKIEIDEKIGEKTVGEFAIYDEEIAYDDDNNVYRVFRSEDRYVIFGCYGSVRAIVSDEDEVLCLINPLMSAPKPYSLIDKKDLEKYSILYSKILNT